MEQAALDVAPATPKGTPARENSHMMVAEALARKAVHLNLENEERERVKMLFIELLKRVGTADFEESVQRVHSQLQILAAVDEFVDEEPEWMLNELPTHAPDTGAADIRPLAWLKMPRVPIQGFDSSKKPSRRRMSQPEFSQNNKPPYSFACLIAVALESKPSRRMTVSELYDWHEAMFPFFRTSTTGWKNSIRHNLSLNRCFVKVSRPRNEPGKGCHWTLVDEFRNSIAEEMVRFHNAYVPKLSLEQQQAVQPVCKSEAARELASVAVEAAKSKPSGRTRAKPSATQEKRKRSIKGKNKNKRNSHLQFDDGELEDDDDEDAYMESDDDEYLSDDDQMETRRFSKRQKENYDHILMSPVVLEPLPKVDIKSERQVTFNQNSAFVEYSSMPSLFSPDLGDENNFHIFKSPLAKHWDMPSLQNTNCNSTRTPMQAQLTPMINSVLGGINPFLLNEHTAGFLSPCSLGGLFSEFDGGSPSKL